VRLHCEQTSRKRHEWLWPGQKEGLLNVGRVLALNHPSCLSSPVPSLRALTASARITGLQVLGPRCASASCIPVKTWLACG
jgi:hypothetical protein